MQQQVLAVASGFTPVQLSVLLAVAAVITLFVGRVVANRLPGKTPPILEGFPYVGGLIKFSKVQLASPTAAACSIAAVPYPCAHTQGPWKVMDEGYTRFGEVFTVPVAHKRVTFLIGPDVAPHFFKATDDEMSQTEVNVWCTAVSPAGLPCCSGLWASHPPAASILAACWQAFRLAASVHYALHYLHMHWGTTTCIPLECLPTPAKPCSTHTAPQ